MTVKIVTDSVADLPAKVAQELGISVVPLVVRFGAEVYRDGIDITAEEFYKKLRTSKVLPITSAPSPAAFAETYDRLAEETDEILVITLTSKLSATYQAALQSIGLMKKKCRVEVMDSQWAIMAQGFIVISAARAAQAGASFDEVRDIARRNISRVDLRGSFDTLEYLQRGGRIGKAQAFLGSVLKINPIITLRNGVVEPALRAHSRAGAIDRLCSFILDYGHVEGIAVEYATAENDAKMIINRVGAEFPGDRIYCTRASPVIGTHTGPSLLAVSVLGDRGKAARG